MNRKTVVLIGLLFVCAWTDIACTAATGENGGNAKIHPPANVGLRKDCVTLDPKKDYEVNVNKEFVVELPVIPSSGYLWYYTVENPQCIELVQKAHLDLNEPGVIGGAKKQLWKFRTKASGTVSIVFKKYRKWLGEESAIAKRTYSIDITNKKGKRSNKR